MLFQDGDIPTRWSSKSAVSMIMGLIIVLNLGILVSLFYFRRRHIARTKVLDRHMLVPDGSSAAHAGLARHQLTRSDLLSNSPFKSLGFLLQPGFEFFELNLAKEFLRSRVPNYTFRTLFGLDSF